MSKSKVWILSTNRQLLSGYAADCKYHSTQCFLYSDDRPLKVQEFEKSWKDDIEIHLLLVASGKSYKTWFDEYDSPRTLELCGLICSHQQRTGIQSLRIVVCPATKLEHQKWQNASCCEDLFNMLGQIGQFSLTALTLNGADDIGVWNGYDVDAPLSLDSDLTVVDLQGDDSGPQSFAVQRATCDVFKDGQMPRSMCQMSKPFLIVVAIGVVGFGVALALYKKQQQQIEELKAVQYKQQQQTEAMAKQIEAMAKQFDAMKKQIAMAKPTDIRR